MKILVSTSWGTACGIADYAAQAIPAMQAADPSLRFAPQPDALDPEWVLGKFDELTGFDALWLNYHRGLHSRWTPGKVQQVQDRGVKVLITFHDTYGERSPDDLTQQIHDVADAFVVHEPCEGLPKQVLIRQGVPAAAPSPQVEWLRPMTKRIPDPNAHWPQVNGSSMPLLGTVGFNFPWKNYARLAEVTAACGWGLMILSNNATDADEQAWRQLNPWVYVKRGWLDTEQTVGLLGACDATIFAYECANSGTSGAIRQGIAARKPVIAWKDCRQFRDLLRQDAWGMRWCLGFDHLPVILANIPIQRCDPGIVDMATRDSWTNQGKQYAALFQGLAS